MEKQVKVFYGTGIIQATLLEMVTEGVLKGWAKLRLRDGSVCYMAERWLNLEASSDTDWRAYLKVHWDNGRNHLRTDCLNEFYTIFRRAAAAYFNKQNHEQDKDKSHHQHGAHEPRRANTVHHTYGRQRPAASLPARDKTEVRGTGRQMKTVQLSLFPDL